MVFRSKTLQDEAINFFEKLYEERPEPFRELLTNLFPRFKEQRIELLEKAVTDEEIKKALFDMTPLKASGNDGYNTLFLQSQWDIVVTTVCEWVRDVFVGN